MKAQVRWHLYRLHIAIAVALLSLVAIPTSLEAGVLRSWDNGAGDDDWFNATNWGPDGGPDSDDRLTITFGSPTTAGTISIIDDGSIVFSGATTASLANLEVGDNSEGFLKIILGADVTTRDSRIGFINSGLGEAIVSGVGSSWTTTNNFHVGSAGTGSLLVTGGGLVQSNLSTGGTAVAIGRLQFGVGDATVQGLGSLWGINGVELTVGYFGSGTLDITDAGEVESAGGIVGRLVDSSGIVHVDGFDTQWNNAGLVTVGNGGVGQVTVSAGAVGTSNGLTVGAQVGSIGIVDITGESRWTLLSSPDEYVIGDAGQGELRINNGSFASTAPGALGSLQGTVRIGAQTTGVGVVKVDGADSIFVTGTNLFVGDEGTGDLLISDGGSVRTSMVTIGDTNTGSNSITVFGGSVFDNSEPGTLFASTVTIGREGNGSMLVSGGTIFGEGPGMALTSNVFVGREATGTGDLTVSGTMEVTSTLDIGSVGTGIVSVENVFFGLDPGFLDVKFRTIIGANGTLNILDDSAMRTKNLDHTAGGTLNLQGEMEIDGGLADFGGSSFSYGNSEDPLWKITNGGETVVNFSWLVADATFDSARIVVTGTNGFGNPSTLRGSGLSGGGGADLSIGHNGTGDLLVSDGGLADFKDDFIVGNKVDAEGTATITGVSADGLRSSVIVTFGALAHVFVGGADGGTDVATGTLTIADGGLVQASGSTFIARLVGSTGDVTIGGSSAGFDAELTSLNVLVGGDTFLAGGNGTLTVNDGGLVNTSFLKVWDQGILTINDGTVNTTTLQVLGTGTLNIEGGTVNATNFTAATAFTFNDGTLNVDGGTFSPTANFTLAGTDNPTINLQNGATGNIANVLSLFNATFNIVGGSTFTASDAVIGKGSGSVGTVNVTGTGSMWSLFDDILVPLSGNGQLNIGDGGTVVALNVNIGINGGSDGVVNVDGAGSSLTTPDGLLIGDNGTALLTITDNATVITTTTAIGADGTFELDGGIFETGLLCRKPFSRVSSRCG